jgi:NADH dehydrogenase FAD-containing subunit
VLALGPNAPWRPAWATGCEHVYDPDFDGLEAADARTVVVGGGITGAQLALRLQSLGRSVCWVTRDLPRVADFDSDPCYAGPRCLAPFQRTPIAQRTALLEAARRPGTLPPDIHARMTAALAAGDIAWQRGEVVAHDAGGLQFADGRHLAADRVILATGFQPQPASDSLLARCIHNYELRCDRHGHVFINEALEAAPGLHLLGNPASLQLGPMAGNIQGARLAGRRLAPVAAHGVTTHHRSQPQA